MHTTAEIRFGDWTLRGQPRELLHHGVKVHLQELPLQILDELLARPGELVTREHLIAVLWPKRVVDYDAALNAAVRRLRAALGDVAETPKYVETLPRHGYRFIGEVSRTGPAAAAPTRAAPDAARDLPPPRRRAWLAAAAVLLAAGIGVLGWWTVREGAQPRSAARAIAVLPFVDLSVEQDQQFFSDGLTEEMISHLAAELPIPVIARTSSFAFKGKDVDIATVAERLGVSHVLEGSVRRSRDEMRITVQLIDAGTSAHLWTQTYDRRLDDILKVQEEIARSVAAEMRLALGTARASARTSDPAAYEHLFRAREYLQRRAPGDLGRARELFERALAIDRHFAPAWAGLASVHWLSIAAGEVSIEAGREQVREAAERALALDPGLAEAHLRLGHYFHAIGDDTRSWEQFRKATAAQPNNPLLLGIAASMEAERDRLDEALQIQRRAVAADPLSPTSHMGLASLLYLAGHYEEASTEFRLGMELGPVPPPEDLGYALILAGRPDEALAFIDTLPPGDVRTQALALAYDALGRQAEADAALAELSRTTRQPYLVAEVHAFRGDVDAAFEWLALDARQPELRGPLQVPHWVKRKSPLLAPLRDDPRWIAWAAPRS